MRQLQALDPAPHPRSTPQHAAAAAARTTALQVAEVRPGVRCPTGEARITPGGDLPAKHVIHTVRRWGPLGGPAWCGGWMDGWRWLEGWLTTTCRELTRL